MTKNKIEYVDDNDPREQMRQEKAKKELQDLSQRIKGRFGEENRNMVITNKSIDDNSF